MKRIIYVLILILSILILDSSINAWNEYTVGQEVEYNGIKFYVIKNSGTEEDSVTMLKAEPLTVEEVNQYGVGHVNRYTFDSVGTAFNQGGYGGMAYYTSETCGFDINNQWQDAGCTANYEDSEIKYVVDAWASEQVPQATNARLISLDDLIDNLGMELNKANPTTYHIAVTDDTPTWVMGENYSYWTMTTNTDIVDIVWAVDTNASVYSNTVQYNVLTVRPVITLSKTALGDIDNSDEEKVIPSNIDNTKKESKTNVKVDNTYMGKTIVLIILGFVSVCSSVSVFYIIRKKGV